MDFILLSSNNGTKWNKQTNKYFFFIKTVQLCTVITKIKVTELVLLYNVVVKILKKSSPLNVKK